jgi:4-hydroxy-3-polyprenylbenzoate decarboxylase
MYPSLREFVDALERAGELKRIAAKVSPVLEITAIADRVSKSAAASMPSASAQRNDPRFCDRGGHALLFENVAGSDFPVLINAWGSYRRMEMALGCHDQGHTPGGFDALGAKIGALVKPEPPRSMREIIDKARQFFPLLFIPPKRRKGMGACQEVVLTGEAIDLTRLPILRCWPSDGDLAAVGYPAGVNDGVAGLARGADWEREFRGRYITLAGIHTVHADDRENPKPPSHNIGMYRVQLFGKRHLSMHWHMHHDGARHWRSWKKLGQRMPVAIVLGGESVMPYAATAPLPPGISELLLAGFLNRGGIPMVRGRTVPLWVPANAEMVIEGYVSHEAGLIGWDPRDPASGPLGPGAVFEGPFGDHTGFYSMPDRYPLLEVTAITHRRGAVYPTTIVGLPPQEDYYLGKATERVFLPLLKTIVHDVEDYDLPMFGTFHNCAVIKLKKAYPLQGRRMMHSVWGAGQMAWTKSIFVVDDDTDPHDTAAVLRAAVERCHPLRDVEVVNGPLDILDHAAPRLGAGMKIGFDCTRKIAGEEVGGVSVAEMPRVEVDGDLAAVRAIAGVRDAALIEGGWLTVVIEKTAPGQGREVLQRVLAIEAAAGKRPAPFVIVLAAGVDAHRFDDAMFHWLAHSDASRDMLRWASGDGRWHRLGFDATPKVPGDEANGQPVRPWPPIIRMEPGVMERTALLG